MEYWVVNRHRYQDLNRYDRLSIRGAVDKERFHDRKKQYEFECV